MEKSHYAVLSSDKIISSIFNVFNIGFLLFFFRCLKKTSSTHPSHRSYLLYYNSARVNCFICS